jgi:hypothetical protein
MVLSELNVYKLKTYISLFYYFTDTDMQCNNTTYTAHGFLNHIRQNAHLGFTPTSAYEFN